VVQAHCAAAAKLGQNFLWPGGKDLAQAGCDLGMNTCKKPRLACAGVIVHNDCKITVNSIIFFMNPFQSLKSLMDSLTHYSYN
jgi:hypothetical protein